MVVGFIFSNFQITLKVNQTLSVVVMSLYLFVYRYITQGRWHQHLFKGKAAGTCQYPW